MSCHDFGRGRGPGKLNPPRIPMVAIAAAIVGIAFVIVAFSKKGL